MTTSTSITRVQGKKDALVRVLCICYSIGFKKDMKNKKALLDLCNKVNAKFRAYISKLGFLIGCTDESV